MHISPPISHEMETRVKKFPQITIAFWVMKICATTLGETVGDLFSMTMHIGYAVSSLILIGLFLASVVAQLFSKKYHPFLYWTVILSTSTAGTTMSDYMDRTLQLGYVRGTGLLLAILLGIFLLWRLSKAPLSVKDIKTFRVEMLYWTAILFSNTLGTAMGDFLSDSSHLGFTGGVLLVSSLLVLIILCHFFTKIPKTLLFWIAFVLTRPFGAELGDLLTKTRDKGGFGFGTIGSSLILGAIRIVFIIGTRRSIIADEAKSASDEKEPLISIGAGPLSHP